MTRSSRPITANVFGNLLKVSSCRFGPSYLHWIRHS
jgi:hypothetical protein